MHKKTYLSLLITFLASTHLSPTYTAPLSSETKEKAKESTQKKNKKNIIIIVGGCIVVLAVAYVFIPRKGPNEEEGEEDNDEKENDGKLDLKNNQRKQKWDREPPISSNITIGGNPSTQYRYKKRINSNLTPIDENHTLNVDLSDEHKPSETSQNNSNIFLTQNDDEYPDAPTHPMPDDEEGEVLKR